MRSRIAISFIIPAYNEERYLDATLKSIRAAVPAGEAHEIIVVDNGSTDRTREIAERSVARVLLQRGGTIGSLRNVGAKVSEGEILVFLDADVTLTDAWTESFMKARAECRRAPKTLSGSMCSVPSASSWIERTWFAPHNDASLTHLGSAHLIVLRETFLDVGGFDESLTTGEDYELCHRVQLQGGALYRLSRVVAEHHGYPKTLGQFMKREMWHGSSDVRSLAALFRSKVALAALAFAMLHAAIVPLLVAGRGFAALTCAVMITALCLASAIRTYRLAGVQPVVLNTGMYYFYYVARSASFVMQGRRSPRAGAAGADRVVPTSSGA